MNKKKNIAWLVLARLVIVSLFLIAIIYFNFEQPDIFSTFTFQWIIRLIIATYLFSILSLVFLRKAKKLLLPLAYSQIVWEIIFVTVLVLITGGITSKYAFLYNLPIIYAGLLFRRRDVLYTASFCSIIYGGILDLHYYGKLEGIGLKAAEANLYGYAYILASIAANILVFFFIAILAGYITERANRSETALEKKEVDYNELQRLYGLLLSFVNTGLISITNNGYIRIFNKHAEELTGLSQEKVYDKHFTEVFPDMSDVLPLMRKKGSIELLYKDKNGNDRIFGVKTVPFAYSEIDKPGTIINFQDITDVKNMEKELKMADRLSAVGELSARMAHEIRNPLTSISGSVQLIAQSDKIDERDRKLLNIVIRESDRLNVMLKEFLNYANPQIPNNETFSLKELTDEVVTLLKNDERFPNISITDLTDGNTKLFADQSQIKQVLINLIINAAQAMPNGGEVTIKSHTEKIAEKESAVVVEVSDRGVGIPEEKMQTIFEPFVTTKAGGTGIGLALVYRVMKAHHGAVSVRSEENAGTTFVLTFPMSSGT
ncbi:MAG: ATP-binding protein [Desulfuromonadales bacterium]|nr:ATP-binding protein [Desulfuromonadales bacterium]